MRIGLGCGGRRIRTFGRFGASGFQDQRIRPLCHAPPYFMGALYAARLRVEPLEGFSGHDAGEDGRFAEGGLDAPYLVVPTRGAPGPVVAVPTPGPHTVRVAVAVEPVTLPGRLRAAGSLLSRFGGSRFPTPRRPRGRGRLPRSPRRPVCGPCRRCGRAGSGGAKRLSSPLSEPSP